MTENQMNAQMTYAPIEAKKFTQHQRIVLLLARREKHTIDQKLAGWDTFCYTTKLATRIGEMERKAGVKFTRERNCDGFTQYTIDDEGLAKLKDYYFKPAKNN